MSGISSIPSGSSYYYPNYSPYACYPEEEVPSVSSNVYINPDQTPLEDRRQTPSVGQAALGGAFSFTSVACECPGVQLTGDGEEADAEVVDAEIPSEVEGDFSYEDYVDEYYDEATDEAGEEDHVEVTDEYVAEDYYEDYTEEEAAPSVCDHSPEPFDLTSPADGLVGVPYYSDSAIDISFPYPHDLDESIGDVVTCYAEIDDDPSFATPIMREVPAPGVLAFTPASPAEYFTCATPYQVRVRCTDTCGNITASTTTRTFETGPTVEWTRTYNGATSMADEGSGIVVDGGGNVYVVGTANSDGWFEGDIWSRSYDSSGTVRWTQTHDGAANDYDSGRGIAINDTGDVFITGCETSIGQGMNIWVRSYDSTGLERWTRTYNSPYNRSDCGEAIAVDDLSGDIVVAGYETVDGSGFPPPPPAPNLWMRRYDDSGNVLWTYPSGEGGMFDSIALGGLGDIYTTGGNLGSSWVRSFDAIGNPVWSNATSRAFDVAADNSGNIYATGSEIVVGEGENLWVRGYNSDGSSFWTRTYNGSANRDDAGRGAAVDDATGDIFITGYETVAGRGRDIWVRRYDSAGNPICTQSYNGPSNGDDEGRGIYVGSDGNVYITGFETLAGEATNIFVRRYSGF